MMLMSIVPVLKISVLVSVLFVWVIDTIISSKNLKNRLPDWLRDFVGILKIICVVLINTSIHQVKLGALVLAILMASAMFTHIRVKNKAFKMLPSTTLFLFSLLIYFNT